VSRSLDSLTHPIVLAPMGGGPGTPELAAAVSGAGGLGILAAGYKRAEAVREEIRAVRAATDAAFGVNVFVPSSEAGDPGAVARYVEELRRAEDGPLGEPRFDDDAWEAKLAVVAEERVPVVSFAFGAPSADEVSRLREAGCEVWITATEVCEAVEGARLGADALVLQGAEAGAHRGSFRDDDGYGELGLLPLLRLAAREVDVPLVAAGGLIDGAGIAAALVAGARAAALGTAFLLCPEAGTSEAHRAALGGEARTALTRAFTGRRARGIVNRFLAEHSASAPSAYPEIHHVTAPLRAAGRERGDADVVNLWAGQAHGAARALPAAELVAVLADEANGALKQVCQRRDSGNPAVRDEH
jgi:nitronate monooxygenase